MTIERAIMLGTMTAGLLGTAAACERSISPTEANFQQDPIARDTGNLAPATPPVLNPGG